VSGTKYREFDADFQSVEKIPSKKVIAKFRNIQFSSIIQCCGKKLSASNFILVKTCTHVHNYEHGQIPMVTDLRRRPVMGFLYLGVEAGGVYRWAIGQRLGTPISQQGEFPTYAGAGIYAAAQIYPL
jgi:hypothetical protein